MNESQFYETQKKFAQRLCRLRDDVEGARLPLEKLIGHIEKSIDGQERYKDLLVDKTTDDRLREEMLARRPRKHILYDIPKSGLFRGHDRSKGDQYEYYEIVALLMVNSGFPQSLLEDDIRTKRSFHARSERLKGATLNENRISRWSRRLVADIDYSWKDLFDRDGKTTRCALPITD